jgi:hypothetical protein
MNGQSFFRRPGPTKGCRVNDDDELINGTGFGNFRSETFLILRRVQRDIINVPVPVAARSKA